MTTSSRKRALDARKRVQAARKADLRAALAHIEEARKRHDAIWGPAEDAWEVALDTGVLVLPSGTPDTVVRTTFAASRRLCRREDRPCVSILLLGGGWWHEPPARLAYTVAPGTALGRKDVALVRSMLRQHAVRHASPALRAGPRQGHGRVRADAAESVGRMLYDLLLDAQAGGANILRHPRRAQAARKLSVCGLCGGRPGGLVGVVRVG